MNVLRVILMLVLDVLSLVLIATVLLQPSERTGLGSIAGGAETFFGKNKARSYEGKLALATKISAVVFIVISIILLLVK